MMANMRLSGRDSGVTAVPNAFIDSYLTKADGEYVKVYLLLWRYFCDKREITISEVADLLDDTEKDVLRALRYWSKQGLLAIRGAGQEVTEICFQRPLEGTAGTEAAVSAQAEFAAGKEHLEAAGKDSERSVGEEPAAGARDDALKGERPSGDKGANRLAPGRGRQNKKESSRSLSSAQRKKLALDEPFGQLVYIVGKYLGEPLGPAGSDTLGYLYETLGMPADLLEYLVETSVDAGHKSLHYIERVALNWHERGIGTIQEAKEQVDFNRRQYYQVLKAFGLGRRGPAPEEKKVMDVWFYDYGFQLEIVLEACNRTIGAIHEPSFEYAGKILAEWRKKGVRSRSDIETLDAAFAKGRESGRGRRNEPAKTNRFHNFDQVGYDYDAIVKELNG